MKLKAWFFGLMRFERQIPKVRELVESEYLDGDGCARITLRAGEDCLDPLSTPDRPQLDPAVFAYIDRLAEPVPIRRHLRIVLQPACADPALPGRIRDLIAAHYALLLRNRRLDLRRNAGKTLLMLLLGLALLYGSFLAEKYGTWSVAREFLSVASSFVLWDAVNRFLLVRHRLKMERLNAGQLAMAEIRIEG